MRKQSNVNAFNEDLHTGLYRFQMDYIIIALILEVLEWKNVGINIAIDVVDVLYRYL